MRLLATLLLSGCGAATPTDPITDLVGEIHIHQYPPFSHAWAAFLADPVPLTSVTSDQLINFDTAVTERDGACALYLPPTCSAGCPTANYCAAPDLCRPIAPVHFVDGGTISITGSTLVPTLTMAFDGPSSSYRSDPRPGRLLLFAGGELLSVEDPGPHAFRGRLPAPPALAVSSPDLTAPLHFPPSGPFEITWKGEGAYSLVVNLSAAPKGGAATFIRCVTPDAGHLTVPAAMMARLPPPPRAIHLQIERDEQQIFPTQRPGVGVIAHAAQTKWLDAVE